jgi:hypothetical protein
MSVLIKGGRIITATDDYVGDIFVDNGTISLIGESLDLPADKVIDAGGATARPSTAARKAASTASTLFPSTDNPALLVGAKADPSASHRRR